MHTGFVVHTLVFSMHRTAEGAAAGPVETKTKFLYWPVLLLAGWLHPRPLRPSRRRQHPLFLGRVLELLLLGRGCFLWLRALHGAFGQVVAGQLVLTNAPTCQEYMYVDGSLPPVRKHTCTCIVFGGRWFSAMGDAHCVGSA